MSKRYYFVLSSLVILAAAAAFAVILRSLGVQLWPSKEIYTQNAFVKARSASISAQIAAPIARVVASDFATVKKGDLLFELDCTDAELAGISAQNALESAQLKTRLALQDAELAKIACEQAEFAKKSAQSAAQTASAELARIKRLHSSGAASAKLLESAQTAASQANAAFLSASAEQKACALKIRAKNLAIRAAEVAENAAEAALHRAGADISRCKIYASADGSLGAITVGAGERAQPGKELVRLIERGRWLQANIKETELADLRVGARARFVTADGREFAARVSSIAQASGNELAAVKMDNSVGNFIKITQRISVLLSISGGEELASGQSGQLWIERADAAGDAGAAGAGAGGAAGGGAE